MRETKEQWSLANAMSYVESWKTIWLQNHFRYHSNLTRPEDDIQNKMGERDKSTIIFIQVWFPTNLHPPNCIRSKQRVRGKTLTHLRLKFEGAKKVDEEEEIIEEVNWWVDDIFPMISPENMAANEAGKCHKKCDLGFFLFSHVKTDKTRVLLLLRFGTRGKQPGLIQQFYSL